MQELKYMHFEIKGPVAIVTIDRPEVRNAMAPECWAELNACMDEVDAHPELRVLILTATGEKVFISGADISEIRTRPNVSHLRNPVAMTSVQRLADLRVPTIAAIHGITFGGGMEIALACDIRIATTNAKFGLPEVNLGILPGAGGIRRLSRLVGLGVTKDVVLAGRVLNAEEAHRMGLVMKVVEREELLDAAMEVAETMCKKAPLSLEICKKLLNHTLDIDSISAGVAEQLGFMALLGTEDRVEGTSAFLEKRPANFQAK